MLTQTQTNEQRGLIAAAQAGDERAFRSLVEPYRRALEVHCYRMLGSPHDAEDLVQETLMRAWRTLERFERRSSIETWLYRIATNACLDELERRPRRPVPVDPYPDERLERAETAIVDPAARYAIREGVELAFLTAIQRLPGRQRAIIILRDVLGWTAPEVAELLESTVAGVNSALQRARATIDAELPASSRTAAAPSDRKLLADYVDAWERADVDGLISLLRADALLRMPPGSMILGRFGVGEFLASGPCGGRRSASCGWSRPAPTGAPPSPCTSPTTTGRPEPHGILVLEVDGDHVATIDAFIDERLVGMFANG